MTDAARGDGIRLPVARIRWQAGQPHSLDHDDVYFSADGVAECERVFIGLNRLRERFAALPAGATFSIGEVGFGTGLNLLTCAAAFLQHAPAYTSLHFISCEYRPLQHADLARLQPAPDLAGLHAELLAAWPPLLPGWQRCILADERVRVSLYFGPALAAYAGLSPQVDAWLLDGFAPDRNPAAWQPALLTALRQASRPGATLATFTAAGNVRRALAAAGFVVERVSGAPHKRHYTRACLPGRADPLVATPIDVVGAGLAGACVARALAIRGHHVRVFEAGDRVAAGTSSNPWAVLHARVTAGRPALAQLRLAGLAFSSTRLPGFAGFAPIGVLQRAGPGASAARLQAAAAWLQHCWPHAHWLDAAAAGTTAGIELNAPALWLPRSGAADLAALCTSLLHHRHISVLTDHRYTPGDAPVVLCTGINTPGVDLHAVAGDIEEFCLPAHLRPACVLSGHGYLLPTARGVASGATFINAANAAGKAETRGLDAAERVRQWLGHTPAAPLAGWHGVRAMSADRMPLVGRLQTGQWLSCGHGSTGLALAPLAGEIIASAINAEPLPAGATLLSPERFVRD